MRMIFLSFLFAMVAGCSVDASPSEVERSTAVAGPDAESKICPTVCGEGTLCLLPDGTCTEVCNSCFCSVQRGTVVASCPAISEPSAASPTSGASFGGVCGNTFCGAGTFCCNASCGICAPLGGFCTQQICLQAH